MRMSGSSLLGKLGEIISLGRDQASASIMAVAFGPAHGAAAFDEKDVPGVLFVSVGHGCEG